MEPVKPTLEEKSLVETVTRRKATVVSLTERRVRDIKPPAKGQLFVFDKDLPSFGVRTTASGVKAYIIQKRVSGRSTRITLARVGDVSLKDARELATKRLGEIADHRDPLQERRDKAKQAALKNIEGATLGEAFNDYLEAHTLKPSTVAGYLRHRKDDFGIWEDTPLLSISGDMIARRHRELLQRAQKQPRKYCRGATGGRANAAMRVLRAVYNHMLFRLEDHGVTGLQNPVRRLTQTKTWNRTSRKNSHLNEHDLPIWWEALGKVRSDLMRDYLRLLLFTGLRRQEGAKLLWRDIDFTRRTLTVVDPKNHRDHVLPLSSFVHELLKRRYAKRGAHHFVFPGKGNAGHLVTPWTTLRTIRDTTGVSCSVHDLRRTYATYAAGMVSYPTLKTLLNHVSNTADPTIDYARPDLQELRRHVERVAAHILQVAEQRGAEVIQLHG